MAKRKTKSKGRSTLSKAGKMAPARVEYLLGKGTSRLLNARVDKEEIHLFVNGPAMLYGSVRLLTSLDMADGATFQAWTKLAASLTCTSLCGHNGKTAIPVTVETSRIGSCLTFSTGPMSMYQSLVVLRPKKKHQTMKRAIDEAFGKPGKAYSVILVPEPATGHAEHDGTIFEPHHNHDHDHGDGQPVSDHQPEH